MKRVAMALLLAAGCEDAGDISDRQAMADESIVDRVWRETWGRLDLGPPPAVVVDEGVDPRCDARRFWAEDHHACIVGVFLKDAYEIRLGRESPLLLGQELAHAAMYRMSLRPDLGPVFLQWSESHSPEYWRQACRAEYWHGLALGYGIGDQNCPTEIADKIALEEAAR